MNFTLVAITAESSQLQVSVMFMFARVQTLPILESRWNFVRGFGQIPFKAWNDNRVDSYQNESSNNPFLGVSHNKFHLHIHDKSSSFDPFSVRPMSNGAESYLTNINNLDKTISFVQKKTNSCENNCNCLEMK